ncbi:MAG: DUF2950 domain-containing protein [Pseudomonadota bacterium]|nr:DUF2950 domain-containing protein [Pseudomonadota bacterium]
MSRIHMVGFCTFLLLSTSMPGQTRAANQAEVFPTPQKAVDALVFASRHNHTAELVRILGDDSEKLVNSGDAIADDAARQKFVTAYDTAHEIEDEGESKKVLEVGAEAWPMPLPLVRDGKGWRFDTGEGEQEILDRRIGRNELYVIEVCRAYVEAQREFAAQHPLPDGRQEYAQKFLSSDSSHDGLYWPAQQSEPESPLGPLIATALAEGYLRNAGTEGHSPYHGYFYRILKAQGPHAPGGGMDYLVDGHMTGGFALIAFPAQYGDSGVMTFIINQGGIVYEKNLGRDTLNTATALTEYEPDPSWNIVP